MHARQMGGLIPLSTRIHECGRAGSLYHHVAEDRPNTFRYRAEQPIGTCLFLLVRTNAASPSGHASDRLWRPVIRRVRRTASESAALPHQFHAMDQRRLRRDVEPLVHVGLHHAMVGDDDDQGAG